MRVRAAVASDRGRVRSENQDSYGLCGDVGLYLVADGMGGRVAGKRASEEAAQTVTEAVRANAATPGLSGADRLRDGIDAANRRLWNLAQADPRLHGMGTTIAAVLIDADRVHIAHVGDSRVYRIRDRAVSPLTRDHSLGAELADRGVDVSAANAQVGHALTRAVGVGPTVEVALATEPLRADDVLVICSDGIYRMVSSADILDAVTRHEDLAHACAAIIADANTAGGVDNSTIIVLRALADGAS